VNNNYTNSILNSITDSLIITTREGLIEELNHSAVKLLGYSSGDLLGRSVAELFVEDESTVDDDEFFSIDSPLMTLIEQGAWRRVDIRMLTKEKVQIPVSLSGEISTMVDGQEYMVSAAQDMREVIKMQEEAQFNAFQAGVAEMGANILHNIGNAVTGIYGNIHKINKQSVSANQ
jgi:PAS domain S-box-containing protein